MIRGKLLPAEPTALGKLVLLQTHPVGAIQVHEKAHQQAVRHHPGLRLIKPQVPDPEAGFLQDLPGHRFLHSLADFTEARNQGVPFEGPARVPGQKQPVPLAYRHNDGGADFGVHRMAADAAHQGPLPGPRLHGFAAAAAEPVCPVPAVQALAHGAGKDCMTGGRLPERRHGKARRLQCLKG